ncbi:MAG: bacterial Ig-like domain-containing protein [Treponema sp.]|jgi:hypothetical protein|nr:bacterial Ig-like domain-containing protein [Treponema sp.]
MKKLCKRPLVSLLGIIAIEAVIMVGLGGCNTLQSIEISKEPARTVYGQGQELDWSGLAVTAYYDKKAKKGKDADTSSLRISGYDKGQPGKQTVTVTMTEKKKQQSATFTVTVVPVIKVTIEQPASKTIYMQGDDFNPAGLVARVEFENGAVPDETISPARLNYSGYSKTAGGVQTITVDYYGKKAETSFDVKVAALTGIAVTTPPNKAVYLVGENLDTKGLTVTGTYEGAGNRAETITAGNLSGFDTNKAGNQTITVDCYGKEATFTVRVAGLTSLVVTNPPDNTVYFTGEDLDIAGLVVKGIWEDVTEKILTIKINDLSSYDKNRAGTQDVFVTYQGKTTKFPVTFVGMQSLSVTQPPSKLNYENGEHLDLSGLVVQGTRQGATSIEMVDVSRLKVSGYERFTEGNQTVTVTIGGKTSTFRVTVAPNPFVGTWHVTYDHNSVVVSTVILTMTEDSWLVTIPRVDSSGEKFGTDHEFSGTYTRDTDSGKTANLVLKKGNMIYTPKAAEILSSTEVKLSGAGEFHEAKTLTRDR